MTLKVMLGVEKLMGQFTGTLFDEELEAAREPCKKSLVGKFLGK